MSHPPHQENCPACGHKFTLADLKQMAIGDGWQRFLLVRLTDGSETVVSFDEFAPNVMTPISARSSSAIAETASPEIQNPA